MTKQEKEKINQLLKKLKKDEDFMDFISSIELLANNKIEVNKK